jgi:uncharacterized membrane protein
MGQSPQAPQAPAGGLPPNVAAALAYIWFLAIVWLLIEPFNRDRFVRFHSFQAIFFGIAVFVIHVGLRFIPFVGWIVSGLLSLLFFLLWVVCIIKALQNEKFKIPGIGDFAEQQAG